MKTVLDLAIVTSCSGYGKYLGEWAQSIVDQDTHWPSKVCIYTHALEEDYQAAVAAMDLLENAGIPTIHVHDEVRNDFGTARNMAVGLATGVEWVMHLDADDMLMKHALTDTAALMPGADVVGFGYTRSGDLASGPKNKGRVYKNGDGLEVLHHDAPCASVSPFRRKFWEQSPYRTDMEGAWDTALWIGFCRLGARFRATKRPCFWYRQHADSIFNKRRLTKDWRYAMVTNHLKSLRRLDGGVAVIVPRDVTNDRQRVRDWEYTKAWYRANFPDWKVLEGFCQGPHWSKGVAVDSALQDCTAEILVVADADCLVPPEALRESVAAVQERRAPWAIPHRLVHRLNPEATERYLGLDPLTALAIPTRADLHRSAYVGYPGGGIFVVRHREYLAAGGIPRVFHDWGSEDQAIAVILDGLLGPVLRLDADLVHLWHTPQSTKKNAISVSRNARYYRTLVAAAKHGREYLFQAIKGLPGVATTPVPAWKRRQMQGLAPEQYRVDLRARQSYLSRSGLGAKRA